MPAPKGIMTSGEILVDRCPGCENLATPVVEFPKQNPGSPPVPASRINRVIKKHDGNKNNYMNVICLSTTSPGSISDY
jgi:hypothetical protein